jgi:FMNH2-dependent dimethyl sulfone monooxygenase
VRRPLVLRTYPGIDGVTLSFVNFKHELPFLIDRVLPLLRQAGLRE